MPEIDQSSLQGFQEGHMPMIGVSNLERFSQDETSTALAMDLMDLSAPPLPSLHASVAIKSATFLLLVSEAEVEVLHELFIKLTSCLSNDNLLTKENFQFILIKNNNRRSLSADRIFGLFDMRNDGAIDFGEFVHTLNIFHPNSSQRDKAIFAFRLYDTRQTGFIEPEEVKEMIIDVLEESELMLSESIIDSIVSKVCNA
ncbi:unnamed protein product [Arabidopsis arenosa]|uniref:Calcineurin B-like protein n=1 Tax=Arabidopsis arenosa TaxID=38785 RepID=A0A8S2AQX6_ARAAE|nr:unnamed protein product [Arabidopsis arenosa]